MAIHFKGTKGIKGRAMLGALAWLSAAAPAAAYNLEFGDKWGPPVPGTGAVITWSFIADGAGINTAAPNYDNSLSGTNTLGAVRSAVDAVSGAGAFDAAIARAFATWSAAANVTFVQVPDNGAAFAGTTAIDIRIGAYQINGGDHGGVGYGPPGPGDPLVYPDPLAGDIAFAAGGLFQVAPGAQGSALPTGPGGAYVNDVEGLMLHELGHALGLGHVAATGDVMCGYVYGSNFDPGSCRYDLVNRVLSADDIAGVQYLYGAAVPEPQTWALWAGGLLLLGGLTRRRLGAAAR